MWIWEENKIYIDWYVIFRRLSSDYWKESANILMHEVFKSIIVIDLIFKISMARNNAEVPRSCFVPFFETIVFPLIFIDWKNSMALYI